MATTTDIFISYRRSDGRDIARTVQLALKSAGAGEVFFDYSSLRDGVFNEKIYQAIDECRVFVLVLSPESLTRCAVPGDWVAIEIDRARQAGCTIIPLAIDSNYDRWPHNLPHNLQFLKNIQQTKLLTDEYFEESVARLLSRIAAAPAKGTAKPPEPAEDTRMQALLVHNDALRAALNHDNARAVELLRRSAAMGFGEASAALGTAYENGRLGLPVDLQKALSLYNEAATRNSAAGWLGLSRLYRKGIGVSGSDDYLEEQAANCLEIARERREQTVFKINLAEAVPNTRMPVAADFRWIVTDRELTVVGRGEGNRLAKVTQMLSGRLGQFTLLGFDSEGYHISQFHKLK